MIIRFSLILLLTLTLIQCKKTNPKPNNKWNPGEEWIDTRDGQSYKTVQIGEQTWMAENLNFDSDGSFMYDNDSLIAEVYGRLYIWETAQNVCPDGWHLPSDEEWTTLENFLIANGYNYDGTTSGNKLAKALASDMGWESSSETGAVGNNDYPAFRNKSGFKALPGGFLEPEGKFSLVGYGGYWWTSSEYTIEYAHALYIWPSFTYAYRSAYGKQHGLSVRCLKD